MSDTDTRLGRGIIFLGDATLERILDLPDGVRITGVSHDFARLGIMLSVEADWLPPLAEGMHPPELSSAARGESMVDENGVTWHRWVWPETGAHGG